MGGVDAVIFTGGIGENAAPIRERTARGLEFAGIRIDPARNAATVGGKEGEISPEGAPVKVLVIPTNEELIIARDALRLIEGIL
jgi:acetate kinase